MPVRPRRDSIQALTPIYPRFTRRFTPAVVPPPGHWGQNRFHSRPLSGKRLRLALRYFDGHPVRAGMAAGAVADRCSSAQWSRPPACSKPPRRTSAAAARATWACAARTGRRRRPRPRPLSRRNREAHVSMARQGIGSDPAWEDLQAAAEYISRGIWGALGHWRALGDGHWGTGPQCGAAELRAVTYPQRPTWDRPSCLSCVETGALACRRRRRPAGWRDVAGIVSAGRQATDLARRRGDAGPAQSPAAGNPDRAALRGGSRGGGVGTATGPQAPRGPHGPSAQGASCGRFVSRRLSPTSQSQPPKFPATSMPCPGSPRLPGAPHPYNNGASNIKISLSFRVVWHHSNDWPSGRAEKPVQTPAGPGIRNTGSTFPVEKR